MTKPMSKTSALPLLITLAAAITLDAARVFPSGDFPGLDEAHFHLPQDFPLRLYQLISVEAPGAPSNYLWVRLE